MQWETVIGLEVHVQLSCKSKIFSSSSTAYGAEPNTQANAVDLGLPGVLPVLNAEAVQKAIKFGLAIDAELGMKNVFARKNYFYPDLPKGYQISQFELPIVGKGELHIELDEKETKVVGVTRAHLEEDAGKSMHEGNFDSDKSAIDLNRAGTPLLEIVSEPDMRSATEAVAYLKKLHALVRYLGISDGNMQEGSFRCDANVSVRLKGEEEFGTRREIKNLNSFRFVEKAINTEVEYQIDLLEDGGEVVQATCLYNPDTNETRAMRTKEDANDYRYFPDPDLLPVMITQEDIEAVRKTLPELPDEKSARFQAEYDLSAYDAAKLTLSKDIADYFEQLVKGSDAKAKVVANWINGELSAALNKDEIEIEQSKVSAGSLAELLNRIVDNTISGKIAKDVFEAMWAGEGSADDIIDAKGLKQITDTSAIEAIIDQIIADNPGQVGQYKAGKDKVFGFFVGQVMKQSKGKANPQQVNALLKAKLS